VAKSANLNLRIEPEIKSDVESLFSQFGISLSEAVNIFFHQSLLVGGLPFEVKKPRYNAETEAAIQEAKGIMSGKIQTKSYTSIKEVIDEAKAELDA
jgi:DNA-damage-inducible protein J